MAALHCLHCLIGTFPNFYISNQHVKSLMCVLPKFQYMLLRGCSRKDFGGGIISGRGWVRLRQSHDIPTKELRKRNSGHSTI